MSLDVLSTTTVNTSTVIPHDEPYRRTLTPGQIALVTIGTSFAFFISIMLIICMGEFLQYNKRKYGKATSARKKLSASGTGYDSEVRSGSQFESSISDYTSSFQARQSMPIIDPIPSTSRVGTQLTDPNIPTLPRNSVSMDDIVTVPFDTSLNDVAMDCDNTCDGSNNDMAMLPLIGRQCDDILDIEGDIFCDNSESRDKYRLEADV